MYFNLVEPRLTAVLLRHLKQGDVFLDIGANVGYYTVLASRVVGPSGAVIAVEPALRNLCFLATHIRLNGAGNVRVVPAACSDTAAVRLFSPGADPARGHLATTVEGTAGAAIVAAITVDALLARAEVIPHVIKIDVEGGELDVLRGAHATLAASRPVILLATHSAKLRTDCLAHLAGYGYRATALDGSPASAHEWVAEPWPPGQ